MENSVKIPYNPLFFCIFRNHVFFFHSFKIFNFALIHNFDALDVLLTWTGYSLLFSIKSMGILDFFSVFFSLRKSLLAIFSLKNVSKTKSTFSLTHK